MVKVFKWVLLRRSGLFPRWTLQTWPLGGKPEQFGQVWRVSSPGQERRKEEVGLGSSESSQDTDLAVEAASWNDLWGGEPCTLHKSHPVPGWGLPSTVQLPQGQGCKVWEIDPKCPKSSQLWLPLCPEFARVLTKRE